MTTRGNFRFFQSPSGGRCGQGEKLACVSHGRRKRIFWSRDGKYCLLSLVKVALFVLFATNGKKASSGIEAGKSIWVARDAKRRK